MACDDLLGESKFVCGVSSKWLNGKGSERLGDDLACLGDAS